MDGGRVKNEVCFDFDIWIDNQNDRCADNDTFLERGIWYLLGTETQRFYLPENTKEGLYSAKVRSVAANAAMETDSINEHDVQMSAKERPREEKSANRSPVNYIAF